MATPFQTSRKSEVLWALPYLVDLTREVLSEEEYLDAEKTAVFLVRNKRTRAAALKRLEILVKPPPQQPLAFAQKALQDLPRWTRDGVKFLSDYIQILVRAMTFEMTGEAASKTRSLGSNIRRIEPKKLGLPPALIDHLKRYNSFVYTPARHDFTIEKGQRHRFTSRETVLLAFITMKLAEQIMALSSSARLQATLL